MWRIDILNGTLCAGIPPLSQPERAGTISLEHPQPADMPSTPPTRPVEWDKPAFGRHWLPTPLASPLALVSLVPPLLFLPPTSSALGVGPQAQTRLATSIRQIGTELPHVTIRAHGTRQDPAWRLAENIRDAAGVYPVLVQTGEPLGHLPPRSAGHPYREPADAVHARNGHLPEEKKAAIP